MASAVVVKGLANIKVDTGSSHALEHLGYTEAGADIATQGYFIDVPGDENGGPEGPPIEIQHVGEIAIIRLRLTKYDAAVSVKCECRTYGGTNGTPVTAGSLMFGGGLTYRLLVHTTSDPRNYPRVVWRENFEVNAGTKYSTLFMVGTAYKDANGVLFNATTS